MNFLTRLWADTESRLRLIIGAFVWLFTLVIYCQTMAPTFSFWDCSEFITCSYILGIPHPPGTPLYIIIGRLFSLMPFFADISVRVNFLSALTSSLAVLFGYLIAVRLLTLWFNTATDWGTRFLIHAGAVCGAFFMAFGFTVWNNAVEAEVYGMTTFIMMLMIWLSLLYIEQRGTATGQKLMLFVFFLAFVGTGVHMTSFLVLPVVGLLFVIKHPAPSRIWYALAIYMVMEIYLIFVLSARMNELPFYLPMVLAGVCYLFYYFSQEKVTGTMTVPLAGYIIVALPAICIGLGSLGLISAASLAPENSLLATFLWFAKITMGGMLIYAVWLLSKWITLRRTEGSADVTHLVPALFILVSFIMVVLLFAPKGYGTFIAFTIAATIGLAFVIRQYVLWPILFGLIGGATILLGVKEFTYATITMAVLLLILGLVFKQLGWKSGLVILALAGIGFSINGYSYVRSQQDPVINQNDPGSSIEQTVNFIERKQYGSQSMIERMFVRRAEWSSQFGTYRRMGFWGFFQEQFGLSGARFMILFLFGLFGIWELIRKTPMQGLSFMLIALIGSVGLILYMNFADGSRINPMTGADYLEVRDRDYFFTPAFVMFGLAIGMGISLAIGAVLQVMKKLEPTVRYAALTVLSLLFLLPGFALAGNYHECDRSRNYIPWDYGFNLLSSCEPNGIIFTNGDNDTFPLWCLQEVYGVRKDVAVVNLSLANSRWYIHQIQNTMKVNLGMTPERIDQLAPTQLPSGVVLRNYDHAINAVVLNNIKTRPLYFSVTVGNDVRNIMGRPADSMLMLEGMMWRITQPGTEFRANVPFCFEYFKDTTRFRTRGVSDTTIYKDDNTVRMVRNYANGFLIVADSLQKAGQMDSSLQIALLAVEKVPYSTDAISFIGRIYNARADVVSLNALIDTTVYGDKLFLGTLLASAYVKQRATALAERTLYQILAADPNYRPAFDGLINLYTQTSEYTKANALVEGWMQRNPGDQRVGALWRAIQEARRNGQTEEAPAESSGS